MWSLLRFIIRLTNNSSTDSQTAQIESVEGELHDDVPHLESYGMTAAPPDDVAFGFGAFVNGDGSNAVILGYFDGQYRPKGLEPGEVCFYSKFGQEIKFDKTGKATISDASGSKIVLENDNSITTFSTILNINAAETNISDDLNVGGRIQSVGDIKSTNGSVDGDALKIAGNSISNHTHTQANNQQTSVMNNPAP